MVGIIDVGGGTRGIYGAGVFDRCITDGVLFDYVIGVSAGSANCASYCAGQKGRNYKFYTDYTLRPEGMGLETMKQTGSFIGLDYIYSTLSNSDGECPLDYDAMMASGIRFEIVATDARTGLPVYFSKEDMSRDRYDVIKASSCVPFVNKPYVIDGVPYFDGGISDPVPLDRAFAAGCDKVVLLLTRPLGEDKSRLRNTLAAKTLRKKYPAAAAATENCADVYAESVKKALELQAQGKVLIVAPDDVGNLGTLSRDPRALDGLYNKGFHDARTVKGFVEGERF